MYFRCNGTPKREMGRSDVRKRDDDAMIVDSTLVWGKRAGEAGMDVCLSISHKSGDCVAFEE